MRGGKKTHVVVETASLIWNNEACIWGQKLVSQSPWISRLSWNVLVFKGILQENNNPNRSAQIFFLTHAFPRSCLWFALFFKRWLMTCTVLFELTDHLVLTEPPDAQWNHCNWTKLLLFNTKSSDQRQQNLSPLQMRETLSLKWQKKKQTSQKHPKLQHEPAVQRQRVGSWLSDSFGISQSLTLHHFSWRSVLWY